MIPVQISENLGNFSTHCNATHMWCRLDYGAVVAQYYYSTCNAVEPMTGNSVKYNLTNRRIKWIFTKEI